MKIELDTIPYSEEERKPRELTVKDVEDFVIELEQARRKWASSPEGYKVLGPGSPNIPGLQEYYQILDFIRTGGNKDPFARR
jgi:hypothetical protein